MRLSNRDYSSFHVYLIFKKRDNLFYNGGDVMQNIGELVYVGQTMDIHNRILKHKQRGVIKKAIEKYGECSVCDIKCQNAAEMRILECILINSYFPEFNEEKPYGGSRLYFRQFINKRIKENMTNVIFKYPIEQYDNM